MTRSITSSLIEAWHNPSSQYRQGKQCKALINESRQEVARMINADNDSEIVFVSGGTEVG